MAANFRPKFANDLHSVLWRFETDCKIAMPVRAMEGQWSCYIM